jgi:CRISPR system Cascade subunit CasD
MLNMTDYLVFRLYGAMASWGQPAVGGDRHTYSQPTKSAILGLMGAAIGIKRNDEQGLAALHSSVRIAVKQCMPSTLVRDYHTTQVPPSEAKLVYRTRKQELSDALKLSTILSTRDYRCDGLWVVAVTATATASIDLTQIKEALQYPVFVPYLGRKSCPLALPMMPQLVSQINLREALDTVFPALTNSVKEDGVWLSSSARVTYYWEGNTDAMGLEETITSYPWDEPTHKGRWQFKQQQLHQVSVEESNVPI